MIFNRYEALANQINTLEGLDRLHRTHMIIELAGDEKLIEMCFIPMCTSSSKNKNKNKNHCLNNYMSLLFIWNP